MLNDIARQTRMRARHTARRKLFVGGIAGLRFT